MRNGTQFGTVTRTFVFYDSFSGDFMLAGNNVIAEWNPNVAPKLNPTSWFTAPPTTVKGELGHSLPNVFDQVSVDGKGQLFAAANNGYLYFIDYSHSPQNISPDVEGNYVSMKFLHNGLDDIVNQLPEVPYAAALMLMRRRRRLGQH